MRGPDRDRVARIDTCVECSSRALLAVQQDGIHWTAQPIKAFTKTYDLARLMTERPDPWDHAVVAATDGQVVGFASSVYRAWNRRADIRHVFVDQAFRRRGAARAMLAALEAWAIATDARQLWLETQDTNCTAIAAYERLGFSIVGFDRSLYENPPAVETGVFLGRPCTRRA